MVESLFEFFMYISAYFRQKSRFFLWFIEINRISFSDTKILITDRFNYKKLKYKIFRIIDNHKFIKHQEKFGIYYSINLFNQPS